MRISTLLSYAGDFRAAADEVAALEDAGLDVAWVPEAYSFDAPSAMGYLAAKTSRVTIASGILPIYTRTPTLLAMTAAGVDALSGGRAMLGIGASGPQVIEGFHGVAYDAPTTRIREIIEICRLVWRRERVTYTGKRYNLPLPEGEGTGLGKPLKLINQPVRNDIPITVAALGPKSVEATAELADGWLPVFFHPERAKGVWGEAVARGAARRDPARPPLEIFAGGAVAIGEGLATLRDAGRAMVALYVGGMGAREKNFYNDVFCKLGYGAAAREIQDLYLAGKKQEAAAAVPGEYLTATSLIGPAGFVSERLAALREAGVNALNVSFHGRTTAERQRTCEQLRNLIEKL